MKILYINNAFRWSYLFAFLCLTFVMKAKAQQPDLRGSAEYCNPVMKQKTTKESPIDFQTFKSVSQNTTVFSTDFVTAGVGGLRNVGNGTIALSGLSGTVTRAYLYWHGVTNSSVDVGHTIIVNGVPVSGTNIGVSDNNCWGFNNSQAYRGDVTALVQVTGNGTYSLSGFGGLNPNGASLIVFYTDGIATNNRDVVIFEGNDSNIFFPGIAGNPNAPADPGGWNVTLSGINYTSGSANIQLHVADGQAFPDDALKMNSTVFVPTGGIFEGNTVPSANNGPGNNGSLWDIRSFNVTSFLSPGPNTLQLTTGVNSDCLGLIVALIDLPAGAAPPPACTVTAVCKDATVILVNGSASLSPADVDGGSTATCGIKSITVSKSTFGCTDVGNQTVTLTVTDNNDNVSTCTATITVKDETAPTAVCKPVTVYLVNGMATLTPGDVDGGSTDDCGISSIKIDKTSFDCSNVGANTVTFTVTDNSGNSATCTATVTVVDNEAPTAVCKPATLTLVNGSATLTAAEVDGGSSDACGIQTMTVDKTTFSCSDIGTHNVTLTVTDANGNTASCQTTVTIVGEVPHCSITAVPSSDVYTGGVPTNIYLGYGPQSVVLNTTATGGAPYTYSWSPAAGLSSTSVAAPVFTPTAPGTYVFTVTVTNNYGCTTTCSITICVMDIRVPGTGGKKVYVCHVPPGNPANAHTIEISVNAVPAHIGPNGHATDRLGKCEWVPCGPNAPAAPMASLMDEKGDPEKTGVLSLQVSPNPTSHNFLVKIGGKENEKVNLRVTDMTGRQIEVRNSLQPNQTLNIGSNFKPGTYTIVAIQGSERKAIQVMKIER